MPPRPPPPPQEFVPLALNVRAKHVRYLNTYIRYFQMLPKTLQYINKVLVKETFALVFISIDFKAFLAPLEVNSSGETSVTAGRLNSSTFRQLHR